MTYYRGEQGSVKFDDDGSGSLGAVVSTRAWTLTVDKAVVETNSMQSFYKKSFGSLLSGSGTCELLYDGSSDGSINDKLVSAIETNSDEGANRFKLFAREGKALEFDAVINSAEFGATVGELQVININFVTTGTINVF